MVRWNRIVYWVGFSDGCEISVWEVGGGEMLEVGSYHSAHPEGQPPDDFLGSGCLKSITDKSPTKLGHKATGVWRRVAKQLTRSLQLPVNERKKEARNCVSANATCQSV